jgi:mannose-1-phosphate guanylyltransferase
MKTYAVILAGGKGERFWPQSRRNNPKQFLRLFGRQSLIQLTSRRIAPVCPLARQRFVIDRKLGRLLAGQLPLQPRNFVYEPYGRNTAPALALAAARVGKEEPDSTLVVLPADHLIEQEDEFRDSVRFAVRVAQSGHLVTFGIRPSRPDTSYGYVEAGKRLLDCHGHEAFVVRRFREKPNPARARAFLKQGNFWWNSGMFVWRADAFLRVVQQLMPEFHDELMLFQRRIGTAGEAKALERLYARAPATSVDYAIMEKADNVAVVRAGFDWDDVGSWPALERHFPADTNRNVALGKLAALDSSGCMTLADTGVIALLGCQDLIVVRTPDAVLVCPKERAPDIKRLLGQIAADPELKGCL